MRFNELHIYSVNETINERKYNNYQLVIVRDKLMQNKFKMTIIIRDLTFIVTFKFNITQTYHYAESMQNNKSA